MCLLRIHITVVLVITELSNLICCRNLKCNYFVTIRTISFVIRWVMCFIFRITNTASQVRPKTPTLAPNFQSLSAKKTPLHSQTTTKSLERRSVSSISNNNRGSSALNSVRSRSTENLLTENKSPTKARSKTTPLQSKLCLKPNLLKAQVFIHP